MANETKVKIGKLEVSSPSFKHEDFISETYCCDGENINPAISVEQIPSEAKSLVLIMDDPDASGGTFVHWLVFNISPFKGGIEEGTAPGIEGKNDAGKTKYHGPCPPSGETHRYFFKIYALDKKLGLSEGADKESIENAMDGHILSSGSTFGLFSKPA
ncbi:MAG: YbhB/YbcL family Raf kinase inhibitor-like protein [Bacteroidetes bacterium]|nr:YbhB/YbcL family Raf kinase inhibitor-like protein [Bacteroidota bacterium]